MTRDPLQAEREHLAGMLEAIQRGAHFLHTSDRKIDWPLAGEALARDKKDPERFETLSAINERFAKLQDQLGAAMRHAAMLAGEPSDAFLKVLSFFAKNGVIDSIETWQLIRTSRNLAAHEYRTDYGMIAEHFNALHDMIPILLGSAARFARYCRDSLGVGPAQGDFVAEFAAAVRERQA
jgi:hypothetical protein